MDKNIRVSIQADATQLGGLSNGLNGVTNAAQNAQTAVDALNQSLGRQGAINAPAPLQAAITPSAPPSAQPPPPPPIPPAPTQAQSSPPVRGLQAAMNDFSHLGIDSTEMSGRLLALDTMPGQHARMFRKLGGYEGWKEGQANAYDTEAAADKNRQVITQFLGASAKQEPVKLDPSAQVHPSIIPAGVVPPAASESSAHPIAKQIGRGLAEAMRDFGHLGISQTEMSQRLTTLDTMAGKHASMFRKLGGYEGWNQGQANAYDTESAANKNRHVISTYLRTGKIPKEESASKGNPAEEAKNGTNWGGVAQKFGGVLGGATAGALSGGGGMGSVLGGAMGAAFGAIPGAGLILGPIAGAIGGAIGSKVDAAKDDLRPIDQLMRLSTSLGASFDTLREEAGSAAKNLHLTVGEAGELAVRFRSVAGQKDGGFGAVQSGVKVSEAYHIQKESVVTMLAEARRSGLFGGDSDGKKMTMLFAETLAKGGMTHKADEVVSMMGNFMAHQANNGIQANVVGYANLLAGIGQVSPMMKGQPSGAIIDRMNTSISSGGSMGDASKNFLYRAIDVADPRAAKYAWEGGIFQNVGKSMKEYGELTDQKMASTDDNRTVLQKMLDRLKSEFPGRKDIQVESLSNVAGLNLRQAGVVLQAVEHHGYDKVGGMDAWLRSHDIKMGDVNAGGIGVMADLYANKADKPALQSIVERQLQRDDLSEKTREGLLNASKESDPAKMAAELAKVMAGQDSEQTPWLRAEHATKDVERAIREVAEQFLPLFTTIKEGISGLHNFFLGPTKSEKETKEKESSESYLAELYRRAKESGVTPDKVLAADDFAREGHGLLRTKDKFGVQGRLGVQEETRNRAANELLDDYVKKYPGIGGKMNYTKSQLGNKVSVLRGKSDFDDQLNAAQSAHPSIPKGFLKAIGTMESDLKEDKVNKTTNATGIFQMMPQWVEEAMRVRVRKSGQFKTTEEVNAEAKKLAARFDRKDGAAQIDLAGDYYGDLFGKGKSTHDAFSEHFGGPNKKQHGQLTRSYADNGERLMAAAGIDASRPSQPSQATPIPKHDPAIAAAAAASAATLAKKEARREVEVKVKVKIAPIELKTANHKKIVKPKADVRQRAPESKYEDFS